MACLEIKDQQDVEDKLDKTLELDQQLKKWIKIYLLLNIILFNFSSGWKE